jgi:uncharacterized protein YktB (UPF0637 family)
MAGLGFRRDDFEVFAIEGFDRRMTKIYERVRPRLIRLGDDLAPELSRTLHLEFFPHVARHARRIANPPPETWTAFGPSPKGYKRYGYLALCISRAGLHARAVVKSDADDRAAMARALRNRSDDLVRSLRGVRIARYDNWDFIALPKSAPATAELFDSLADALEKKTGGIDVGFGWDFNAAPRLDRAELLDAFRELAPLYRTVRSVVA